MKRKILSLTLCFTILFSSFNIKKSYANPIVAGYVITQETFNIIVGFGALCGITALNVDSGIFDHSSGDFVEKVLDKWSSLKVDSGDFTTKKEALKGIEEEIKNGSTKDPNDPKKISLSSTLISTLLLLFDDIKSDEVNNVMINGSIPFYPDYNPIYKEFPEEGHILIPLPNTEYMEIGRSYGSWISWRLNGIGSFISTSLGNVGLTFAQCSSSVLGGCASHSTNKNGKYYHLLGINTDTNYLFNFKGSEVYYISNVKYMDGYNSKYEGNVINNNDIPNFTNPNVSVNGNLDIPSNGGNNSSTTPIKPLDPPKFPNLQDFDFSGLNLDSLVDVFSNFKNKFPFSLPFDLVNLFTGFVTDPVAPVFEVDFFDTPIILDLTEFDELANIIRMFVLLGYVVSLMFITKKFGG